MPGESPLKMMQAAPRPLRKRPAPRHSRLRTILALLAIAIIVAIGWAWGWYYAASIADRALSGWIDREAALGRIYACGSQSIGGFPFRIVTRCDKAAARFNSNHPPFDVRATGVTFSAELYRPTLLRGEITGPVTLADPGQTRPKLRLPGWSHLPRSLAPSPRPEPKNCSSVGQTGNRKK